jgi:hypothetical protein
MHGPVLKADEAALKPKVEQRIFLQAEQLPIFSSPKEKAEYEQKLALIKQRQQSQKRQDEEEEADKEDELAEEEEAEEQEILSRDADRCIHGEGPCPKVCRHRTKYIRVVLRNATAYEGQSLCARFGWSLLDYSYEDENELRYLKKKCGGYDRGFWIRSLNGVDGGACMRIDGGQGIPVGWVLSADDCIAMGQKYVLCQTGDPVVTASGTHSGAVAYTTTTEPGTLTTTRHTQTVTITVARR